jgi:hypothetical protein
VFDAITGNVQGWWDHSFSKSPRRIYIEPKLGGSFIEIFDDAGNGAVHGTVIYFDRGRRLRLVGPLGFSGHAIQMVHTFDLSAEKGNQTRLKLLVSASGVTDPSWPQAVDKVWQHFLFDRLKPFVGPGQLSAQAVRPGQKPAAKPASQPAQKAAPPAKQPAAAPKPSPSPSGRGPG